MITMSLTAVGLGGAGVRLASIDADGNLLAAGQLTFDGTTLALGPDLNLVRDAADALALRRGTNPQALRVYNTFTDTSNYERVGISWAGNVWTIGLAVAGTGNADRAGILTIGNNGDFVIATPGASNLWKFQGAGNGGGFIPSANNTRDIGNATTAIRNIFVAGAVANRTKAGTPVDGDVNTPTDGMLIVDTTASKIWARIGGVWKGVVVA